MYCYVTGKWVEHGALWTQCGYRFKSRQRKDAGWNSRGDVEAGECRVSAVRRKENWGTE